MSKADRKKLLAVVETRFDYYSAHVVLDEALAKAGLAGREELEGPELTRLAAVLAGIRTRMEWVAYEVGRLASGDAAPAVALHEPEARPAPQQARPAPKVEAKVEAKAEKKADKPAAPPQRADVPPGGVAEARAPAKSAGKPG